MVKVYAAEMLSVLLQGNEENQKIIGEKKGVDILLKQLAYFKKRNPKGKFFNKPNLSTNNRLRDRSFSSKSRKVTLADFL